MKHSTLLIQLNRLTLFISIFAISRIALLALFIFVTHGREISNDVASHFDMIRDPLCILQFTCPQYDQYPPLLPIFETIFGTPANLILPKMATVRLVMMVYETIAAWAFFQIATIAIRDSTWRSIILAQFIIMPMMFMTSTIMGANTMIGGAFILLGAKLAVQSSNRLAIFVLSIGAVAGKQFLVLPLAVSVLFPSRSSLVARLLAASAPILVIFGGLTLWRILHAETIPLIGFKPDPYFGTNFWVALRTIYDIDISKYGTFSGLLALGLAFIPIGLGYFKAHGTVRNDAILLSMAASLILFFSFFYHVNPDYFVLCLPLLMLVSRSRFDLIVVWLVGVTPWIGKFFQLLVFQNNVGNKVVGGKALILNALSPKLMDYAETILITNQFLFSALTIFVGTLLCVRIAKLKSA